MRKVLFSILILTFLPGCIQNTAMVGPGITLVSTGNFSQAFGTFLTNRAVENETGLQAHELITKKVEEQHIKKQDERINKELSVMLENNIKNKKFLILLENNIKKTRKKIIELN